MAAKKQTPIKKSEPVAPKKETRNQLKGLLPVGDLFTGGYYKKFGVAMVILMAIGFFLYLPTLPYEYVLDDKIVITDNQYVKKGLGGIWDILTTESFQGYFGEQKDLLVGARYRPLSIVTFAIEYEFFGLSSKIGHLGNIILYILSVLLLMRILSALFPNSRPWYFSIPFVASLLFLLHPVHTEVVANIKGRDEIMTLLGALGALYFYLRYLKEEKPLWLAAMAISYFLGLLSKENALTFLAIIPATGYFFTQAQKSPQIKATALLLAVSVLYLFIRTSVIGYLISGGTEVKALMNNPFLEMTGAEKYATIMYTLGLYLKLLVFPHPLTHDYYPYHIPIMSWADWKVLLSFALYLGLAWAFFKGLKSRHIGSYAILFYLASLSIVSNFFLPVGTFMNERFIYISSIAFCLMLAWFLFSFIPSKNKGTLNGLPVWSVLVLLPFLLGFAWKTRDRIPVWKNGFELNKAAIEVSKNSARANMFMGTAYFNKYQEEQDPEKKKEYLQLAAPYIERSLEIHPAYGDGLQMKAGVAAEVFKMDNDLDKLLDAFYIVLTRRPSHPYANEYLDYMARKQFDPSKQEAFYFRLAYEYHLKEAGRADIAINFLKKGLQVAPGSARLNKAMAKALDLQGNSMESRIYHQRAESILPGIQL
jgi:protein O-mannosyl-transferase